MEIISKLDDADKALWKSASNGDVDAEEALVKKYSDLVRACARPYFLVGGDGEDLIQEGMFGLISAVRRYDPEYAASFKTFAELCIRNRLYTAIKSALRFKHSPLNDSISLESLEFEEGKTLQTQLLRDPEELVIVRELTCDLEQTLAGSLSKFEKQVLSYYLDGFSYSDIAVKVGKTVKSVDNAVQRIRKKSAQLLNSGDISAG